MHKVSYPLLSVDLRIKYLLQGGMSGKGSLLAQPSGPRYLISMENSVLGLHDHRTHSFNVRRMVCIPGQASGREWGVN